MSKQVTENNTKAQILEAYKKVVAELQAQNSTKLDPAGEVSAKKNSQTLEKADSTVEVGVADKIAALQKNITNVLGGLAGQLNEEIDTFNNLQNAIKLKEKELQELFGIEKEAFSLAALINTQTELKEKFNAEQEQKIADTRKQLEDLNTLIQTKRIEYQKEINEMKAQDTKERQREKEEYTYSFERYKRQAQDSLNDELEATRKEFEEEVEEREEELEKAEKQLEVRETAISLREEKMEELESKVADFPNREAQIRKEADEAARKDEQRTSAIKESYVKKHYENEANVLNNKISLLEESLKDEKARNVELTAKLDQAYKEMKEMALKSVEGSNGSQVLNQIQNLMSQNQK